MGITHLPVLPEDYPLFDWEDWPNSRAALVPGGPTKNFEKACWNSMCDTIVEAYAAAGFEWRDGMYDPEIMQLSGPGLQRLNAIQINNLIVGIDKVVRLPWIWEIDESFRGYTGRRVFYKSTDEHPDIVYPEYFLELVKHINKAIEILRGTAATDLSDDLHLNIPVFANADMDTGIAATQRQIRQRSGLTFISETDFMSTGEFIEPQTHQSFSRIVAPQWHRGGIIYTSNIIPVRVAASGNVRKAAPMEKSVSLTTQNAAAIDFLSNINTVRIYARYYFSFSSDISVSLSDSVNFATQISPESLTAANADKISAAQASASCTAKSYYSMPVSGMIIGADVPGSLINSKLLYEVSAVAPYGRNLDIRSYPASSQETNLQSFTAVNTGTTHMAESSDDINLIQEPRISISDHAETETTSDITVLKYQTAPVFAEKKSKANTTCELDMIQWLYPVWVDGGLLIRQAYAITQNENGELEVR